MRLSEAILLGRHTIVNPAQGVLDSCAIAMCLNGVGKKQLGCNEGMIYNAEHTVGNDYYQLLETWPWLRSIFPECPKCKCYSLSASAIVHHVFDYHVMEHKNMTIEQMCDWIRSIEPEEPTQETSEISEVKQWEKTLA